MKKTHITTYENQKAVTLHSARHDSANAYGMLSVEASKKAATRLKYATFQIWVIICLNQDGYQFALSPAYFKRKYDISDSSYRRAVKELEKKGYLKRSHGNNFDFYEDPDGNINASQIEMDRLPFETENNETDKLPFD